LSGFTEGPWWVTALAVVGVFALVSVVVSLFFSLGRRPGSLNISERPPVGSETFLRGLSGTLNAPLLKGGTTRLLNNGVEIFPAMLEAIRRAEKSVHFMAYIWQPGRASDAVLAALTERAKAGVEVRLMLDGMGGMKAPRAEIQALRDAGGKVQWFHQLKFGKLTSFYKRNHRRAIVVDGKIAFTGGAAVADEWLGDAESEEHWRDMMVEVRGCLANNLQSAFTQLWANTCGEILMGDDYYQPDDHTGSAERRGEDGDSGGRDGGSGGGDDDSDSGDGGSDSGAVDPNDRAPRDGEGEEISRHIHVISSPAEASHPLHIFFWTSFACARERIWLTSAYFAPDDDTRKILAERARAGVDVRLLLPNKLTDAPMVRLASHAYYGPLLEAGVRIFEFQPSMMHAKTLVVDGVWSIVGSANMDIRSKELNQEGVLGIADRGFGKQLEETFLNDLKKSNEIKLEEWKRRSLIARFNERLCLAFVEQY
jgi:cardiolipin synthase A/B